MHGEAPRSGGPALVGVRRQSLGQARRAGVDRPTADPPGSCNDLEHCARSDRARGAGRATTGDPGAGRRVYPVMHPRHAAEPRLDLTDHFWPPRLVLQANPQLVGATPGSSHRSLLRRGCARTELRRSGSARSLREARRARRERSPESPQRSTDRRSDLYPIYFFGIRAPDEERAHVECSGTTLCCQRCASVIGRAPWCASGGGLLPLAATSSRGEVPALVVQRLTSHPRATKLEATQP
jgi:hypothetical protein